MDGYVAMTMTHNKKSCNASMPLLRVLRSSRYKHQLVTQCALYWDADNVLMTDYFVP